MNIGIDARLLERRITGIGRSLLLFLKEIPRYDNENKYFLFSYEPLDMGDDFYTNIPTMKSPIPQKLFSPLWSNFILPRYINKNKIDILFSVNQILPLYKVKGCKYVSMVHDVIYKADPDFLPSIYRMYLQFFAHFSIRISDLIITISEYSKKDILRHYNIDEGKIKVILQSANKEFRPLSLSETEKNDLKKSLGISGKIVLYVGMLENRKNISGIIKVADELLNTDANALFLLVGKVGYGGEKILREARKRKNIKHLTNIDDNILKKLYNTADAFLFPSYYEGFGYPPLEAMQSGLPVVASDNTSLSEIIAQGGILHDADDFKSMANDIKRLLSDENFSRDMRNLGIKRAADFSLDSTVKEIIGVFNSFRN